MTTETATNRSIDELLKLDKYDGLTDPEVRRLIDYNINSTKSSESIRTAKATASALHEANEASRAAICEDVSNVLQSIIESHTNFEGVTPTSVTNFLTALEEV